MKICVPCAKEMICAQNGVYCDYGHGHVYVGDKYRCPICGAEVVDTNPHASLIPNLVRRPGVDLDMTKNV